MPTFGPQDELDGARFGREQPSHPLDRPHEDDHLDGCDPTVLTDRQAMVRDVLSRGRPWEGQAVGS
ncbi:hypothetical protein [Arsenicicoccus dermatophilus]|uniref:hypothetical protein n=1 Tax=Arsenicicoccus dermatophilus TaxID=1076331 RepID=UPI003916E952